MVLVPIARNQGPDLWRNRLALHSSCTGEEVQVHSCRPYVVPIRSSADTDESIEFAHGGDYVSKEELEHRENVE